MKDLMLTYKRTKPELKKSIRFISCGHYLHFSCYINLVLKYLISAKANEMIFICPLCKTMSNNFIPCFDFSNLLKMEENPNNSILRGTTFAEIFNEKNSFKNYNFYEIKQYNLDPNVINSISHFVEKIVSMQSKQNFLVNDFKKKKEQTAFYESMRNFFLNSLNLLDLQRYDDYPRILEILKEFIISLRILIKSEVLDQEFFFHRLITIQNYWNSDFISEENLYYNIDTDKVSQLLFENVFLCLVLLEESETNFFNILFNHTTPLIFLQFFVLQFYIKFNFKISQEIFEKNFVMNNFIFIVNSPDYQSQLKEFFNFFLRKIMILKNLFREEKRIKDTFTDIDSEFSYYLEKLNLDKEMKIVDLIKHNEEIYPTFWKIKVNIEEMAFNLFGIYKNSKLKMFATYVEGNYIYLNF